MAWADVLPRDRSVWLKAFREGGTKFDSKLNVLKAVPQTEIFEFKGSNEWATVNSLLNWAGQSPRPYDVPAPAGTTAAFCKVSVKTGKIACLPSEIRQQHIESQQHCKHDSDHPIWSTTGKDFATFASGLSRPERSAVTDCVKLQIALGRWVPRLSHINRAWERKGLRRFEGLINVRDDYRQRDFAWSPLDLSSLMCCMQYGTNRRWLWQYGSKRHDCIESELEYARKRLALAMATLEYGDESPLYALPQQDLMPMIAVHLKPHLNFTRTHPRPALFELPEIDPRLSADGMTDLVIFAYRQGAPGMTLPHGIAPATKKPNLRQMHQWHIEPGGAVVIAMTCNHPDLGSAGYFLDYSVKAAKENYRDRLCSTKLTGLHDDRFFHSQLKLSECNYICACNNSLPLTWAGNPITDPLVLKGQGASNRKYFKAIFRVNHGDHELPPDHAWPVNIRPSINLRQFIQYHEIKLKYTFLEEAWDNPTGFLRSFWDFWVDPRDRPAKRQRQDAC